MGMISKQIQEKKASPDLEDCESRKRTASGTFSLQTQDDSKFKGPASPSGSLYRGDIKDKRPAEVFRTDFITAMKIADNQTLQPGKHFELVDTWRQEWEKGVQVPVNPKALPTASSRKKDLKVQGKRYDAFSLPKAKITRDCPELVHSNEKTSGCLYDLDDMDVHWLQLNKSTARRAGGNIDECMMERAIALFERKCFENMAHAVATKKGLSIEYDDSTTCDVCLSPDTEDSNEIVFCDACNMCVHQACYGIPEIPTGTWLCRPCSRGVLSPPCIICPTKGGAMKRVKNSFEWIHVICAWWIPEVKIEDTENVEKMTVDKIPTSRKNLCCTLCREKIGACIQCSVKRCVAAYHVTCAVKEGLEMKTVMMQEKDDVQHISYCKRHCIPQPSDKGVQRANDNVENQRLHELQKLQEEFFKLVDVRSSARELRLNRNITAKLFSYWVLKRKANENRPLVPLTTEQQEKLSGKQGIFLIQEQINVEMERYALLRQDLERLRNLCYLIIRRERTKREVHKASQEVFYKQEEILNAGGSSLSEEDYKMVASGNELMRFTKFPHYASDGPPYADHLGEVDVQENDSAVVDNFTLEQEVNYANSKKDVGDRWSLQEANVAFFDGNIVDIGNVNIVASSDKKHVSNSGEEIETCSVGQAEKQHRLVESVIEIGVNTACTKAVEIDTKNYSVTCSEDRSCTSKTKSVFTGLNSKESDDMGEIANVDENLEIDVTGIETQTIKASQELRTDDMIDGGEGSKEPNQLLLSNVSPDNSSIDKLNQKQLTDKDSTDNNDSPAQHDPSSDLQSDASINEISNRIIDLSEKKSFKRGRKRKLSEKSRMRRVLRTSARLKRVTLDDSETNQQISSDELTMKRDLTSTSTKQTGEIDPNDSLNVNEAEAIACHDTLAVSKLNSERDAPLEPEQETQAKHGLEISTNVMLKPDKIDADESEKASRSVESKSTKECNKANSDAKLLHLGADPWSGVLPHGLKRPGAVAVVLSSTINEPSTSSNSTLAQNSAKNGDSTPSQKNCEKPIVYYSNGGMSEVGYNILRNSSRLERSPSSAENLNTDVVSSAKGVKRHTETNHRTSHTSKYLTGESGENSENNERTYHEDGFSIENDTDVIQSKDVEVKSDATGNGVRPKFATGNDVRPNSDLVGKDVLPETDAAGNHVGCEYDTTRFGVSFKHDKIGNSVGIESEAAGMDVGQKSDVAGNDVSNSLDLLEENVFERLEKHNNLCNGLSNVCSEGHTNLSEDKGQQNNGTSANHTSNESPIETHNSNCNDNLMAQNSRVNFDIKLKRINAVASNERNIFDFGDAAQNPVVLLNELSNLKDVKRPCNLNGLHESPRKNKKSGDIPSPAFPHSVIDDLIACPQRLTRGRTQLMMMGQCEENAAYKRPKKRRRTVCGTSDEGNMVIALSGRNSLVENLQLQRLTRRRLRSLGFEKSTLPDLDLINDLNKEQKTVSPEGGSAPFSASPTKVGQVGFLEQSRNVNNLNKLVISPTRLTRARVKSLGLEHNIEDIVLV